MLSERSQSQNITYCLIPFIYIFKNNQNESIIEIRLPLAGVGALTGTVEMVYVFIGAVVTQVPTIITIH